MQRGELAQRGRDANNAKDPPAPAQMRCFFYRRGFPRNKQRQDTLAKLSNPTSSAQAKPNVLSRYTSAQRTQTKLVQTPRSEIQRVPDPREEYSLALQLWRIHVVPHVDGPCMGENDGRGYC